MAPFITYELREQDVLLPLTPRAPQVLQTISSYCAPLFTSELQFKRYVLNHMKEDGTELFITHLRCPTQPLLASELVSSTKRDDIVARSEVLT